MHATVYLEDLRCDGSGHGGCQAGCKLYWKEAWLRRVTSESGTCDASDGGTANLEQLAQAGTRTVRQVGGNRSEVWRCQATEALKASEHLKVSDVRQYWRELTNGNFGLFRFLATSRPWICDGDRMPRRVAQVNSRSRARRSAAVSKRSRLTSSPATSSRCEPRLRLRRRSIEGGFNRGLSFRSGDASLLRTNVPCGEDECGKSSMTRPVG